MFGMAKEEDKLTHGQKVMAPDGAATMQLQLMESNLPACSPFLTGADLTIGDIWVWWWLRFMGSGMWAGIPADFLAT